MKDLFYATRLDKAGNKLMTSYTNAASCKKYGGAGSTLSETLYRVQFKENGGAYINDDVDGPLVRSLLVNNTGAAGDTGKYVLYGKMASSGWSRTPFSFSQYGSANTAMKAMIGMYEALMIVVEDSEGDDDQEDNRYGEYGSHIEVTGEI
jgi:hypothetical protein